MTTEEEPLTLASAIALQSHANTSLVVDYLTLWLANQLMPLEAPTDIPNELETSNLKPNRPKAPAQSNGSALLLGAIANASGPIVLVSNETGLGVIPMGRMVRAFVDAPDRLNQSVATASARVTLMAAGLPMFSKDAP